MCVRGREGERPTKMKMRGSRFLLCPMGCCVGLQLDWALFLRDVGLRFGFNWPRGHRGGLVRYSNIHLWANFDLPRGRVFYVTFYLFSMLDKFQTVSYYK